MKEAKWQAAEKAPFRGPPALNGQKFKPLIGYDKAPLSFVAACLHRTSLRKIGHSLILSSSHHLLPSSSSLHHHTNTTNNNTNSSTFAQQPHSPLIYNWIGY
ncbi:hypothetical protein CMV_002411 [Castanea mollissima]|uniref:Uncharacterized protein n=1 Tax=Castanea mollissima TaxID=60419 RepID=A0A8J4VW64_9ROSI|nr:hypothetical protein CMV_002411 [Castanea mollissima]